MNGLKLLSMACALALSACATVSPAPPSGRQACPEQPAPPPRLMTERREDFLLEMCSFLFDSPSALATCKTNATSGGTTHAP